MSAISDVLQAANRRKLSARAVARAAQERGYTLNHDTAARYLRGDHGRPDEATLVALAEVLDVSLARLRTAAGLPSELTTPYVPPPEAARLNRRQRLAVDEIIRAMLQTTREPAGDDLASRRGSRARAGSRTPARKAARRGSSEPSSG
jgi:transcriptional regulator with XRE-family HTH domain